ncbi:hypothetical protein [Actinopolymorpha pittospori]
MPTNQTTTNQTSTSRRRRTDTTTTRRRRTSTAGARSTPAGPAALDEAPTTAERTPLDASPLDPDTALDGTGAPSPDTTSNEPVSPSSPDDTDDTESTDDTEETEPSDGREPADDTPRQAGALDEVAEVRADAADSERLTHRPGRRDDRLTHPAGRHRLPQSTVRPPMIALLSGVVYLFTVGRLRQSARRGTRVRQSILARPRKDGCADHR